MALRSPTGTHSYWGAFSDPSELPNVSGAALQSADLEAGDRAYSTAEGALYVCDAPGVGSAVWSLVSSSSQIVLARSDGSRTAYGTIAAALAAAVSGDAVLVGPGTFAESLTIPAGVLLQGMRGMTVISGAVVGSGTRLSHSSGTSYLRDVSIQMPTNGDGGILVTGGSLLVENVEILCATGASGAGVACTAGAVEAQGVSFRVGTGVNIGRCIDVSGTGSVRAETVHAETGITVTDVLRVTGGSLTVENFTLAQGSTVTDAIEVGAGSIDLSG